jgi:hypothetical protein
MITWYYVLLSQESAIYTPTYSYYYSHNVDNGQCIIFQGLVQELMRNRSRKAYEQDINLALIREDKSTR